MTEPPVTAADAHTVRAPRPPADVRATTMVGITGDQSK